MTRGQQQQLALGLLIVVMIGVYVRAFRRPHQATPPPASPVQTSAPSHETAASASEPVSLSLPDRSAQREAQHQEAARLTWERDPFTRGASIGQLSGFTLSGILWDAAAPMAIINGQTFHVGDELEGYRVLEIATDHVSVSDGVETFQLTIVP